MFIGAYLCVSGFVFLLCIYIIDPVRKRLNADRLLTFLAVLLILIIFEGLSAGSGIVRFGQPVSFNYPGDYLAGGLIGRLILVLSGIGVLAPSGIGVFLTTHRRREKP